MKAAVEGLAIGSLFTGSVLLAAQRTVMIQIAAAEVRAEPAVALDFVRSQSALLSGVQGVEVWVRRGGELHGTWSRISFRAHQVVATGFILARGRRG